MRLVLAIVFCLATGTAGCTDDDAADGAPTTTSAAPTTDAAGDTAATAEPVARVPEDPAAGHAVVVLGGLVDATLDVTSCAFDAADVEGTEPVVRIDAEASGSGDGTDVVVQVNRFVAAGAAETITDTVTVRVGPEDEPSLVLQAQRFEVDGLVTDTRDPDADEPLLRRFGDLVEARGVFAPPGNFADDGGLVEGIVRISCPAD